MIDFPWWFLVVMFGVIAWPSILVAGLAFAALAVLARGWVRGVAIVLLVPCVALTAIAAWWGIDRWSRERDTEAYEARIHEVLGRDRVVNAIPLPAGTEIEWTDVGRVDLRTASPPAPIMFLGVRVDWLSRAGGGTGWDVQLPEPEAIDGWTCQTVGVHLSGTGQLLSCSLAAERVWQGWPIPAGSIVEPAGAGGEVGLALATGTSMAAPEIGHALTATGGFALNSDGSVARFYFDEEDPLVVAGKRLWNTVEWTYDPATLGEGRGRPALSVRGSLVPQDDGTSGSVTIRLADGKVVDTD